jgi:hypothetical protein
LRREDKTGRRKCAEIMKSLLPLGARYTEDLDRTLCIFITRELPYKWDK